MEQPWCDPAGLSSLPRTRLAALGRQASLVQCVMVAKQGQKGGGQVKGPLARLSPSVRERETNALRGTQCLPASSSHDAGRLQARVRLSCKRAVAVPGSNGQLLCAPQDPQRSSRPCLAAALLRCQTGSTHGVTPDTISAAARCSGPRHDYWMAGRTRSLVASLWKARTAKSGTCSANREMK